jgi:hypothetical protein
MPGLGARIHFAFQRGEKTELAACWFLYTERDRSLIQQDEVAEQATTIVVEDVVAALTWIAHGGLRDGHPPGTRVLKPNAAPRAVLRKVMSKELESFESPVE